MKLSDFRRVCVGNPKILLQMKFLRRRRRRDHRTTRRAVQAASKAFASWSRVIPRERGRMLQKIADAVEAQVEELARIVAEDTGNAIPLGEHVLSYTRREPIGVVGAIIPWNAPVILAAL